MSDVYIEQRGNRTKHRKYSKDDEKLIVSHTERFQKQESHYTRSKNSNEYFSEDLKYNRLYLAFRELHPNTQVTYRYYTDMVKKNFLKLRFQKPRKDTCGTCKLLHSKTKNEPTNKKTHNKTLDSP